LHSENFLRNLLQICSEIQSKKICLKFPRYRHHCLLQNSDFLAPRRPKFSAQTAFASTTFLHLHTEKRISPRFAHHSHIILKNLHQNLEKRIFFAQKIAQKKATKFLVLPSIFLVITIFLPQYAQLKHFILVTFMFNNTSNDFSTPTLIFQEYFIFKFCIFN
jgi:hypothetical protein